MSPRTLVDLLRSAAQQRGSETLYTFESETRRESIGYAELDRRSRAIGAELQRRNAAGRCVLLLCPPGLDYIASFFGCLYAGALAVPAYPPLNERQGGRLQAIAEDAGAGFMLSTPALAPLSGRLAGGLEWIGCSDVPAVAADDWQAPALKPEDIAFVQYTSGSTAAPKGVTLTHANLLHNLGWIVRLFGLREGAPSVSWLPPYHDLGLIGQILLPLYRRMPTLLMPPEAFLKRPLRWLAAVSQLGAELSGGPNFAYDLCVRKIPEAERASLDLRCWRVAYNAADPIRADTLERFARTFQPSGFDAKAFYPCYGMAEATLVVSFADPTAPPVVRSFRAEALEQGYAVTAAQDRPGARRLVGCGRAAPDQHVVIVDPETGRRCPAGRVGEIWVSGPSVAAGYWRRPEATRETFQARIIDEDGGRYLRTGDLGFELNGELFVTGRLKDLIIVRGRKHHAEDIELTAGASHPDLRPGCGAAFDLEREGQQELVVVHEVRTSDGPRSDAEIVAAIRHAVAEEHGLDLHRIVLLAEGQVPKTSSGKIQRRASREALASGRLSSVLSWQR